MDRREFLAAGSAAAFPLRRPVGPPDRPSVVIVFLRGGADGLSIAIPHGDARYYAARPHCAVPVRDVIDLDGDFGLHPALAPLKPWWDRGRLAVAPAAGFAGPLPGHPAAQARVNRWLDQLNARRCASLAAAARLLRTRHHPDRLAVDSWGWDTHLHQGATDGPLATRLRRLGRDIDAFTRALGAGMRDVALITVSEFGRSVAENRLGGTNHGHATTVLAVGGAIAGGVWGHWPGLDDAAVPVTADVGALFGRAARLHTVA